MNELPRRKQIRLKDYNYSQNGYYFITICSKDRQCLFCNILRTNERSPTVWADNICPETNEKDTVGADIIRPQINEMDIITPKLYKCGYYIKKSISEINCHYKNVFVDKYVIMPNHIHMILVIVGVDTIHPQTTGRIISAPRVSVIVGQMKRWVSKQIGFSCWQKSFYEHIIRNENEYQKICEYIENNPKKWAEDKYNI